MSDIIYWDHDPDCWQRWGVDCTGDIALTPKTEDPYCSWSLERRLEDDPSAEPPRCKGRWVKLVEVSE